jgi:hypothetical protein
MATTDTRSGFRLPWSSDRSNDHQQPESQDEAAEATLPAAGSEEPADDNSPSATEVAEQVNEPGPDALPEPATSPAPVPEEPEAMVDTVSAATSAREAAPRKPSKLMADLAAAMRSTAETAREQALSQLEADAGRVVETVRARSTEGAAELRQRSDEDIAGIRDWSKAEIARIREETDRRISERKGLLETEVAEHAAAIDHRIEGIQRTVADYQADMADFFERLLGEADPARLATMAESMPEPPSLDAWADVEDLVPAAIASAQVDEVAPDAQIDEVIPGQDAEVAADVAEVAADVAEVAADVAAVAADVDSATAPAGWIDEGTATETQAEVEAGTGTAAPIEAEAPAEAEASAEADDPATPGAEGWVEAEAGAQAVETTADDAAPGWPAFERTPRVDPWGASDETWLGRGAAAAATEPIVDEAPAAANGWGVATEPAVPESEVGAPGSFDRGAVMSALEATAEGIAAAEADAAAFADEYAAQGYAEGDGWAATDAPDATDASTAREPASGTTGADDADPEAQQSLVDRLANLIPRREEFEGEEMQQTQVVVTGLVSVASIASFKRHLSRIAGVQGVAVASGPQGEFVFNATHRADVSFRDALPTLPGFGARVTGSSDGVVNVAAHDPETEG